MQRLESYKSKLILFPRRADKPKKGQVSDSTAEKLKSAEAEKQNTSKHILPKPRVKARQTPVKLTKDLKDVKVYRKIRQLQVNKKHQGKREKRAKEAAEKQQ